jgi:hypothetical protein
VAPTPWRAVQRAGWAAKEQGVEDSCAGAAGSKRRPLQEADT